MEEGVEQRVGVGCGVFTLAIQQVVVGRAQREEPVAGVYYPADEGLDSGQRLVVGLGDEPAVAKVPAQEVQPVRRPVRGPISVEGRGREFGERLFHFA